MEDTTLEDGYDLGQLFFINASIDIKKCEKMLSNMELQRPR